MEDSKNTRNLLKFFGKISNCKSSQIIPKNAKIKFKN
jgi:hypothetical protein